jgi:hypothetical protein
VPIPMKHGSFSVVHFQYRDIPYWTPARPTNYQGRNTDPNATNIRIILHYKSMKKCTKLKRVKRISYCNLKKHHFIYSSFRYTYFFKDFSVLHRRIKCG